MLKKYVFQDTRQALGFEEGGDIGYIGHGTGKLLCSSK